MDEKILLGDLIYQLHKKETFYGKQTIWSDPFANFSASTKETIAQKATKFVNGLKKKKIIREDIDDLICVLGDWKEVAEGIFFTTKAIYVDSPKNKGKSFRVRYDDITELKYYSGLGELDITDYEGKIFNINTKLWNVYTIKLFLEFASNHNEFSDEEVRKLKDIELPHLGNKKVGAIISGTIYGNVSNASTIYGEEKFHASRGHGFAAERANTLYDKLTGHDAKIVGDDNAKNGADRMVDGVNIQSKYCKTGSKCISECFEDGTFRYINADGTPMKIEVPSDKYDAAVSAMKNRISKGEVPGVTDPEEASNIVCKGKFTYEQVKNIAKAGTVESITYDATNGAIIATTTFGITTVLSFATSIWNGEEWEFALKNAAANGLKVGGVSFVTAVLAGQLTKAGLNSMLVGSSEAIIKILGPKGSAVLVNAFRNGKNIYGAAAMKSAAKMLRGNIITGIASVVILSAGDVVNIFRKRISGGQLLKNVANTVSSVAGGTAGWIGGAATGAAIGSAVPVIGNVIGGVAGGVIGAFSGGAVTGKVTDTILSNFIEDDANEMVKVLEAAFVEMATDYLLTQREIEHVIDHIGESINGRNLKDMFASENRKAFAKELIIPYVDKEIKRRKKIGMIGIKDMQYGLRLVLEAIADSDKFISE